MSRPGALVHVLALSDVESGGGPRISQTAIRDAFDSGWTIEQLQPSRYRPILDADMANQLRMVAGAPGDLLAWLARIRRT